MTTIALDGMGGDDAPRATVEGAVLAASRGASVALVGDSERLGAELNRVGGVPSSRLRIVHAPDVVEMGDHAAREMRRRRQSSIYVATDLVRTGEAQAVVSMGNTGATMATALAVLGRLKGIERPALGAVLPAPGGTTLLLDAGANADARPSHLVQFAHMGAAYMRTVFHVERPRIGLLSIGEEATKGSSLVQEVHALLERSSLDFAGNIEGRDIVAGAVDVVVTDGFTGNVALKLIEGTISMLFGELRVVANSGVRARLGGALLLPVLREMRDSMDYRRYGAAPLLGVTGGVFVGHGRSDAEAVANAITTAARAMDEGLLGALGDAATEERRDAAG